MNTASKFNLGISEASRIFNSTDEVLRSPSVTPQRVAQFKMLTDLIVGEVITQPLNNHKFRGSGSHTIQGLGATVCSFSTLSVYHFIRTVKEVPTDHELALKTAKRMADEFYFKHEFRSGVLPLEEEKMAFFSFRPSRDADYYVEHILQVLDKNVNSVQVCHLEMISSQKVTLHA